MRRLRHVAAALAYADQLCDSPYAWILDKAARRTALVDLFSKTCLEMLCLPSQSPLATCVDVGCLALPKLAKLANVLKDKYAELFRNCSTLPLDLDLGHAHVYHSTFTCPISKEIATQGNPPTLLSCGHVLSLCSVSKLACGSRAAKFKCPYCPAECTIASSQRLSI